MALKLKIYVYKINEVKKKLRLRQNDIKYYEEKKTKRKLKHRVPKSVAWFNTV